MDGIEIRPVGCHGSYLYRHYGGLLRRQRRAGLRLRTLEESEVNAVYVVAGVVALAVMIYLLVALLWPEKF